MVRRVIVGMVMGALVALSGCATTEGARGKATLSTAQSESGDRVHGAVATTETDRFSSGSGLGLGLGGPLSDSQDPIPIFPKDPTPVGGIRNPGNPGSSPLPSTNPVASPRR